jgi:hypothetical protein
MTGADPNISWLDRRVALDDKGFIKTGLDLSPDNLSAARWPLTRQPYLLETSLQVFLRWVMYEAAASSECCVRKMLVVKIDRQVVIGTLSITIHFSFKGIDVAGFHCRVD